MCQHEDFPCCGCDDGIYGGDEPFCVNCDDVGCDYCDQGEEPFEDDGQPSEYDEWQDYMGGDDWDHGQYDDYDSYGGYGDEY